eukprot:gene27061-35773_t
MLELYFILNEACCKHFSETFLSSLDKPSIRETVIVIACVTHAMDERFVEHKDPAWLVSSLLAIHVRVDGDVRKQNAVINVPEAALIDRKLS